VDLRVAGIESNLSACMLPAFNALSGGFDAAGIPYTATSASISVDLRSAFCEH
jgi:hypothetical protein